MKYEDAKLLLAWARLQREIAIANNPGAAMDVPANAIHKSSGYRGLRNWFDSLSQGAKERTRGWLRLQLIGVRQVLAQAKASGESLSLADIEILIRVPDADAKPKSPPQVGQKPEPRPLITITGPMKKG